MNKSARSLHNADIGAGILLTPISSIQRSFVARQTLAVSLLTLFFSSVAGAESTGTRGTITIALPKRLEKYRLRVGAKAFSVTNLFQSAGFSKQPGEHELRRLLQRRG